MIKIKKKQKKKNCTDCYYIETPCKSYISSALNENVAIIRLSHIVFPFLFGHIPEKFPNKLLQMVSFTTDYLNSTYNFPSHFYTFF